MKEFKFNTSIAALMEFTNAMSGASEKGVSAKVWDDAVERLMLLLAPMAPHITEELWEHRGRSYSIHLHALPTWDESLTTTDMVTVVVQVNGKLRGQLSLPVGVTEQEAIAAALADPTVQRHIVGHEVVRKIYVPGKLVNLVVK
jgi:leucyl-tRNA synthetase